VVGQVKSGKSSLINALLGESRAPVDTLPLTDAVDLYECQPEGLPQIILRDTPGYGAAAEDEDPFSRLGDEIQGCDLLLLVCTARSAARQSDRALLRQDARVLQPQSEATHATGSMRADARRSGARASDSGGYGRGGGRSRAGCDATRSGLCAMGPAGKPGRHPGGRRRATARRRASTMPPLHPADPQEQDEDKVLRQLLSGLRLTGGWIVGKR